MENFAHVALWQYADGRVGAVVLAPQLTSFHRDALSIAVQYSTHKHILKHAYFFSPSQITKARELISIHYPTHVCLVCLNQNLLTPCWYWAESGFTGMTFLTFGALVHPITPRPPTAEAERQAALDGNNNALSQLAGSFPDVRNVLVQQQLPTRNSPLGWARNIGRRRGSGGGNVAVRGGSPDNPVDALFDDSSFPQTIHQAPTPAGTIRCHTCGQVIPPGFDKTKDAKRTEDEVYAECKHDFDENKICRKCRLPQRPDKGSRFAWLEVD